MLYLTGKRIAFAYLSTMLLTVSSGTLAESAAPAADDHTQTSETAAVDEEELVSADFRMPINDAFVITGTGTVVTGKIESGYVRKGATLCLEGVEGQHELIAIERFRKVLERASAGEFAGLLFTGLSSDLASASSLVRPCE